MTDLTERLLEISDNDVALVEFWPNPPIPVIEHQIRQTQLKLDLVYGQDKDLESMYYSILSTLSSLLQRSLKELAASSERPS